MISIQRMFLVSFFLKINNLHLIEKNILGVMADLRDGAWWWQC